MRKQTRPVLNKMLETAAMRAASMSASVEKSGDNGTDDAERRAYEFP